MSIFVDMHGEDPQNECSATEWGDQKLWFSCVQNTEMGQALSSCFNSSTWISTPPDLTRILTKPSELLIYLPHENLENSTKSA